MRNTLISVQLLQEQVQSFPQGNCRRIISRRLSDNMSGNSNRDASSDRNNSSPKKKGKKSSKSVITQEDDWVSYTLLIIILVITIFGRPSDYPQGRVSLHQVCLLTISITSDYLFSKQHFDYLLLAFMYVGMVFRVDNGCSHRTRGCSILLSRSPYGLFNGNNKW